jgi:hypothetical protein
MLMILSYRADSMMVPLMSIRIQLLVIMVTTGTCLSEFMNAANGAVTAKAKRCIGPQSVEDLERDQQRS